MKITSIKKGMRVYRGSLEYEVLSVDKSGKQPVFVRQISSGTVGRFATSSLSAKAGAR